MAPNRRRSSFHLPSRANEKNDRDLRKGSMTPFGEGWDQHRRTESWMRSIPFTTDSREPRLSAYICELCQRDLYLGTVDEFRSREAAS